MKNRTRIGLSAIVTLAAALASIATSPDDEQTAARLSASASGPARALNYSETTSTAHFTIRTSGPEGKKIETWEGGTINVYVTATLQDLPLGNLGHVAVTYRRDLASTDGNPSEVTAETDLIRGQPATMTISDSLDFGPCDINACSRGYSMTFVGAGQVYVEWYVEASATPTGDPIEGAAMEIVFE
ncbi:MAG: hypothetical protein HY897_07920 [Deltaproteobacteria bacterium]|nr:hypothetical protein [Deltaproteobacteria bacterium]